MIMDQQYYNPQHQYQHHQPHSTTGGRGIYSNPAYGGMEDYYSGISNYNNQGYHGNRHDYQGYQPSYSHRQSYQSYY